MKTYTLTAQKIGDQTKPFDLSKLMVCIRDKKVYVRTKGDHTAFRNIRTGAGDMIHLAESGPDVSKPDDKIYMFDDDSQIVNTLNDGQCLNKWLYKPKKQEENILDEDEFKKLLGSGKYVGMALDLSGGSVHKRHISLILGKYEAISKHGEKAIENPNFNYFLREYGTKVCVFDDKYEFFGWLNS